MQHGDERDARKISILWGNERTAGDGACGLQAPFVLIPTDSMCRANNRWHSELYAETDPNTLPLGAVGTCAYTEHRPRHIVYGNWRLAL